MPKFNEYTEKTNPDDVDIFLLQDAASTRKISFLNIFNRIKTKLGLGELATKSKVAQSDLEAALANLIAGKLTSSGIANNLTTTDTTKVLAAPQGKALLESITSALTLIGSLDALTTTEKTNLVGSINELVTSLTALNSNLSQGGVDNDVGYSKFPDGTYIQWGFFDGTAMTNSNKNATRQVTFRENFAGTAPVSVLITPANANYLNGYCVDNIAATGCRVILMGALAANTTYDSGFRWLAIGRWK